MQIPRRQRAGGRPARRDLDPTALALLERHSVQILATARRYAATPEDAEDAYQRAFEILLTKAPTTSEEELVPWLKTVVLRTIRPLGAGGQPTSTTCHSSISPKVDDARQVGFLKSSVQRHTCPHTPLKGPTDGRSATRTRSLPR